MEVETIESYIEVALIQAFLIQCLACFISGYATCRPLRLRGIVTYALSSSLVGCCFFDEKIAFLMIMIELLFFVIEFHRHIATYCCALALRFLTIMTFYRLFGGTIDQFQYFPPLTYQPFFVWSLMIFAILLLLSKWGHFVSQANFIYTVRIDDLKLRGYLDSGNNALWEGYPIIFMEETRFQKCSDEHIVSGKVHTIGCEHEFIGKLLNVYIEGGKQMKVIVVASQRKFPMHCVCLLNLNQVTRMEKI